MGRAQPQYFPAAPQDNGTGRCNAGDENHFFFNNFISLFLSVLSLCCFLGFSVVVASGGYSLVAMLGLLIGVASLVAKHGL